MFLMQEVVTIWKEERIYHITIQYTINWHYKTDKTRRNTWHHAGVTSELAGISLCCCVDDVQMVFGSCSGILHHGSYDKNEFEGETVFLFATVPLCLHTHSSLHLPPLSPSILLHVDGLLLSVLFSSSSHHHVVVDLKVKKMCLQDFFCFLYLCFVSLVWSMLASKV